MADVAEHGLEADAATAAPLTKPAPAAQKSVQETAKSGNGTEANPAPQNAGEHKEHGLASPADEEKQQAASVEQNSEKLTKTSGVFDIGKIQTIKVRVQAILGGTTMSVSQLANLKQGDLVPLDTNIGDEIDILANGVLIGRGEIVVIEDEIPTFGITLTGVVETNTNTH